MTKNLVNSPVDISLGGHEYRLEYDNRAYAGLESCLGANIFRIYERIFEDSIGIEEIGKVFEFGLKKHHSSTEIAEAMGFLGDISLVFANYDVIVWAFAKSILPEFSEVKNPEKKFQGRVRPSLIGRWRTLLRRLFWGGVTRSFG